MSDPADAPRFLVRRETDRRAVEALLAEDRAYAAYALGHLEDELWARTECWVATLAPDAAAPTADATSDTSPGPARSDAPRAPRHPQGLAKPRLAVQSRAIQGLVMHGDGALGRTLVVAGDPRAVQAVLAVQPGPISTYLATSAPEHLAVLNHTYVLSARAPMMRMAVTRDRFIPPSPPDRDRDQEALEAATGPTVLRRLDGDDAPALNALYGTEGGPTHYRAADIERGIYIGAFRTERLLAAAGTHIVGPRTGVAVVGNVFTHPAHRGQGLAGLVTGAVTAALFEAGLTLAVLTVDSQNTPAVRAYARLGYDPGARVLEGIARRRDWLGIGARLRRRSSRAHSADGSVSYVVP